jgi:hypothetical protein
MRHPLSSQISSGMSTNIMVGHEVLKEVREADVGYGGLRVSRRVLRAATISRTSTLQYLLAVGGGASVDRAVTGYDAVSPWTLMQYRITGDDDAYLAADDVGVGHPGDEELSSLLKVMVMLDDPPAHFISALLPHHGALCVRGRHLRAMLPTHQKLQGVSIAAHCPLPIVLQSLVAVYALTDPEEMWMTGLYPASQVRPVRSGHYFQVPKRKRSL